MLFFTAKYCRGDPHGEDLNSPMLWTKCHLYLEDYHTVHCDMSYQIIIQLIHQFIRCLVYYICFMNLIMLTGLLQSSGG
jgi:hypothetical protein